MPCRMPGKGSLPSALDFPLDLHTATARASGHKRKRRRSRRGQRMAIAVALRGANSLGLAGSGMARPATSRWPCLQAAAAQATYIRPSERRQRGFAACRVGEASHPGPDFAVEAFDVDLSDGDTSPELQGALRDGPGGGGAVEGPQWSGPRPEAPRDCEARAVAAAQAVRMELRNLRLNGIPPGHTWSAVLAPLIWLSFPVYAHGRLLPAMVAEDIDLRPLRRLTRFWRDHGVLVPDDLLGWMRPGGAAGWPTAGDAAAAPFGYAPARAQ